MKEFEVQPETTRGRVIYRLLLRVHAAIRSDLEHVERLAAQALEGLPAEELTQQLEELKRNGMLWRLRVDCLRYCYFVHSHHNAENVTFFPELRATNPAIDPVIDRLEADHQRRARTSWTRSRRQPRRWRATTAIQPGRPSQTPCGSLARACLRISTMRSATSRRPSCDFAISASPSRREPSMEPVDEAAIRFPAASTSARAR